MSTNFWNGYAGCQTELEIKYKKLTVTGRCIKIMSEIT